MSTLECFSKVPITEDIYNKVNCRRCCDTHDRCHGGCDTHDTRDKCSKYSKCSKYDTYDKCDECRKGKKYYPGDSDSDSDFEDTYHREDTYRKKDTRDTRGKRDKKHKEEKCEKKCPDDKCYCDVCFYPVYYTDCGMYGLSLEVTATPTQVLPGDLVTMTFTITNTGTYAICAPAQLFNSHTGTRYLFLDLKPKQTLVVTRSFIAVSPVVLEISSRLYALLNLCQPDCCSCECGHEHDYKEHRDCHDGCKKSKPKRRDILLNTDKVITRFTTI